MSEDSEAQPSQIYGAFHLLRLFGKMKMKLEMKIFSYSFGMFDRNHNIITFILQSNLETFYPTRPLMNEAFSCS